MPIAARGHPESGSLAVGIWIRVSTEDQAQGESPEHHERRARMYAESKGWNVVRLYDLSGVSGKTVMEHPETRQMLEDVAAGRVKGLIFSKLARLARNTRELLDFAEYFEQHGAHLISLDEAIDTSSPAGRLFYTLIAAMAQWEREEISDRVKASVVVRAKMGKSTGGAAPFGYRWEDGRLQPDPTEAPVRARIYELFAQEKRLKTVATLLNEAGHRTRKGAKFSDTTVKRLLEDPTAKGIRRANYTRSKGEGMAWELKDPEEWVHTPVEAVVSEELWDACNTILDERRNNQKPTKRAVHLFAGRMFCGCGGKMMAPSNLPKYVCQKCRRKIRRDDVEEIFREQLQGFYLSEEEVREHLEQADANLLEKRALVKALKAEEARLRTDMDKTYKLYLDGVISTHGFGERYKPLEERLEQLTKEIPRLQGETDFLAEKLLSSEEVIAQARDLYGRWNDLPFEDRRRIVETVVDRVTVDEDSVTIDLAYTPTPHLTAAEGQRNLTGSWRRPA